MSKKNDFARWNRESYDRMDHGDYDAFYLNYQNNQRETVTAYELNNWLNTLEGVASGVKINVILEVCKSGSFIDLAQTISKPGRVVMASTGAHPLAYASQPGATFSDAFVSAVGRGMSLQASFEEARWGVQPAHPDQTPWLDDNGNGIPNESGDGQEASRRGFAYAGTLSDALWPPYIAHALADQDNGKLEAEARAPQGKNVSQVWALVYAPLYQPPASGDDMAQDTVPKVNLQDSDEDGVYTATYTFAEQGA